MKQHESNMRYLWDNIKWTNLHIIGIPEGEEKEKEIENIFEEIMAENFSNLKDTDIKINRKHRGPKQVEPKQAHTKIYYNKNGKSQRGF